MSIVHGLIILQRIFDWKVLFWSCSFERNYRVTSVDYRCGVASNFTKKIYIGLAEPELKEWYNDHKQSTTRNMPIAPFHWQISGTWRKTTGTLLLHLHGQSLNTQNPNIRRLEKQFIYVSVKNLKLFPQGNTPIILFQVYV